MDSAARQVWYDMDKSEKFQMAKNTILADKARVKDNNIDKNIDKTKDDRGDKINEVARQKQEQQDR